MKQQCEPDRTFVEPKVTWLAFLEKNVCYYAGHFAMEVYVAHIENLKGSLN